MVSSLSGWGADMEVAGCRCGEEWRSHLLFPCLLLCLGPGMLFQKSPEMQPELAPDRKGREGSLLAVLHLCSLPQEDRTGEARALSGAPALSGSVIIF